MKTSHIGNVSRKLQSSLPTLSVKDDLPSMSSAQSGLPKIIPPEVFVKMSKKVAQLTKVIHYLYSKQDDHDVHIESLIDAYEHEVDTVIVDANQKLDQTKKENEELKLILKVTLLDSIL